MALRALVAATGARRRWVRALASAAALAAPPVAAGPGPVDALAAVEAERASLPAAAGAAFADSTASGGQGLLVWSEATATVQLASPRPVGRVRVVARGDQCAGSPSMTVSVDGRDVLTALVGATAWQAHTATGAWAAGTHTVAVRYSGDTRTVTCDRNLRLDVVSLEGAPTSPPPAPSPLAGARLWVDPASAARAEAAARRTSDPAGAAQLDRVAAQPGATWFGDWVPTGALRAAVAARVDAAAASGTVPVLVAYAVPHRDCGSYSAGGLAGPAAYGAWVRALAAGIGTRRAVVVLEPDALAQLDCLPAAARAERLALLRDAVAVLAGTGAVTYLDAGNSGWVAPETMAERLRSAGVASARGFATNVANFHRTADEVAYGDRLAALTGAHYVVDTSRNGLGPATGHEAWCNPPGRALGERPTTATGRARADAFLWVKRVGESDGECGRGEPAAGTWWPEYAIGLAARAAW